MHENGKSRLIVCRGGQRLAARTADQQQQWQAGVDDTKHQREVVIIGDHCRLEGDLVIWRGDTGRIRKTERCGQVWRLGELVIRAQVLDQVGMNDLSVLAELRFQDRDADAAAEHPH